MNLALKDIRHGLFRFVLTCLGLGLLMTVVLAMIGIYNGLVSDALAAVKAPAPSRPDLAAPPSTGPIVPNLVGDSPLRPDPAAPVVSQNGAMQVGWPSVFGYDSLEPAAHIALASSVPDPRSTAYDILGVTHVLAGGPLDEFTTGEQPLTLVGQQGSAWVYSRERSLPLARLVYNAEIIPDAATAIVRIHDPSFDPASVAILDSIAACEPGPDLGATGAAVIVAHEPTRWEISTTSETPALLILAENDYPGWEVTVDGQPAEALTAYTSIRAVCVPAGDHLVVWNFVPRLYLLGALISGLAILLVIYAAITIRRRTGGQVAEKN